MRPLGETNDAEQPGMRRAASRARANHAESAVKPYVSVKYCAGAYSNVHIFPASNRPARTVSREAVWAPPGAAREARSARAAAADRTEHRGGVRMRVSGARGRAEPMAQYSCNPRAAASRAAG